MAQAMEVRVEGRAFRVEFSYTRRRHLARGININGVAVCAIVEQTSPSGIVALGTAVCSPTDQFSRREGRVWAFSHAIERLEGKLQLDLLAWFRGRFAEPQVQPPKPKNILSAEEIEALKNTKAAASRRERRAQRREIVNRSGTGK